MQAIEQTNETIRQTKKQRVTDGWMDGWIDWLIDSKQQCKTFSLLGKLHPTWADCWLACRLRAALLNSHVWCLVTLQSTHQQKTAQKYKQLTNSTDRVGSGHAFRNARAIKSRALRFGSSRTALSETHLLYFPYSSCARAQRARANKQTQTKNRKQKSEQARLSFSMPASLFFHALGPRARLRARKQTNKQVGGSGLHLPYSLRQG